MSTRLGGSFEAKLDNYTPIAMKAFRLAGYRKSQSKELSGIGRHEALEVELLKLSSILCSWLFVRIDCSEVLLDRVEQFADFGAM